MSEAKWKAYIKGKKYGPVDADAIGEWIAEGRVTEKTQLWRPGMPKWIKAAEIDEFAHHFGGAEEPAEPAAEEPEASEAVDTPAEESAVSAETYDLQDGAATEDAQEAPTEAIAVEQAPVDELPSDEVIDDEAVTVIAESPFAEQEAAEEQAAAAEDTPAEDTPAEAPTAAQVAEEKPVELEAEVVQQPRPRPTTSTMKAAKPPLPLLPFLFSLLALLTVGLLAFSLLKAGTFQDAEEEIGQDSLADLEAEAADIDIDLDDDDEAPAKAKPVVETKEVKRVKRPAFWIAVGVGAGLIILMIFPLFFNRVGLVAGILGSVIALGGWIAIHIVDKPADLPMGQALKAAYIQQFMTAGATIVSGVMSWLLVLVPLFALVYYAFSGKYRARIS